MRSHTFDQLVHRVGEFPPGRTNERKFIFHTFVRQTSAHTAACTPYEKVCSTFTDQVAAMSVRKLSNMVAVKWLGKEFMGSNFPFANFFSVLRDLWVEIPPARTRNWKFQKSPFAKLMK